MAKVARMLTYWSRDFEPWSFNSIRFEDRTAACNSHSLYLRIILLRLCTFDLMIVNDGFHASCMCNIILSLCLNFLPLFILGLQAFTYCKINVSVLDRPIFHDGLVILLLTLRWHRYLIQNLISSSSVRRHKTHFFSLLFLANWLDLSSSASEAIAPRRSTNRVLLLLLLFYHYWNQSRSFLDRFEDQTLRRNEGKTKFVTLITARLL